MILLIDNYDSFTYNLYQLVGTICPDIVTIRNDAKSVSEIRQMKPQAIILSPGPGKPSQAGICEDIVRQLGADIPILGVCLGHQAICEAYGGTVDHAAVILTGDKNITDIFSTGQYNHYSILQGTYPEKEDEAVIEDWTAQRYGLQTGDLITVSLAGVSRQLRITGICENLSSTQSEAVTGVFIPLKGEYRFRQNLEMQLFIRFKAHVKAEKSLNSLKQLSSPSAKVMTSSRRITSS